MALNVGDGILQTMAERGDSPLCDSKFLTNSDGSLYERGLGRLGYYHASNASGSWVIALEAFQPLGRESKDPGIFYIDCRHTLPVRQDAKPYPQRPLGVIDLYVVHYTASAASTTPRAVAEYQTGPNASLPFPAIAYHLLVDGEGGLYLCHDFATRVWGSDGLTVNDRAIHACFTGDHEPAPRQLVGLRTGLRLAEQELGRPLKVEGHKDRSKTACPGPTWPAWKEALR